MEWIDIKSEKPKNLQKVLVYFYNELGKSRITIAEYVESETVNVEDFLDLDCSESFAESGGYDEEGDFYWAPGGFYEYRHETDINYYLTERVLGWMPLLKAPSKEKENVDAT